MKAALLIAGLALLVIGTAYLLWAGIWAFTPPNPSYDPAVQKDGTYSTVALPLLRQLVLKQLAYIQQNVPKHFGADKSQLDALATAANSASLENLTAIQNLSFWYALGYYPATALKEQRQLNQWQYGQGMNGWFWFIGHFPESGVRTFVQIGRTTPVSPEVSAPLSPAEVSYYNAEAHISVGQDIEWMPSVVSGGKCVRKDDTFSLVFSGANGQQIALSSLGNDTFSLALTWGAGSSSIRQVFSSDRPPSFNAPDGCLMCVDGVGTPYYSYSSPTVQGSVVFRGKSIEKLQGDGWIDRQLGGAMARQGLILGLLQMLEPKNGLGPYIWMNLHLDGRQYMIYKIMENGPKLQDTLDMSVIKYADNQVYYDRAATATVKAMNGVFPSQYEISITGEAEPLVATSIGTPVFLDGSGNHHWAGGGTLTTTKDDSASVGWSFLEGSDFDSADVLTQRTLLAAGIQKTDWALWSAISPQTKFNRNIFRWIVIAAIIATLLVIAGVTITSWQLIARNHQ